jgi:hypothetical protein
VRVDFPDKAAVMAKVETYRKAVAEGRLTVPGTLQDLSSFTPPKL